MKVQLKTLAMGSFIDLAGSKLSNITKEVFVWPQGHMKTMLKNINT